MEKSSITNAILFIAGTLSFVLSFVDKIDPLWRNILLIVSPILLCVTCFFIFLSNQDEIQEKITKLEEKIMRAEDLITIKADIELLKRKLK